MATRKPRKFVDGGDIEAANATDDPIASLNASRRWTDSEAGPAKKSFKEAFAEARKSGGKSFEWEGKKFTTDLASDKPKAAAVSTPAKEKYETPYDRMNRQNREAAQSKADTKAETERLAKRSPAPGRGVFKTSEQKFMGSGMKKGGSVSSRADGIAQRGKTRGKYL
jgi:hypothetical protein